MGGRAGGGGPGMGTRASNSGLARGETEAGYSTTLARSVLKVEKEIKDQKFETVVVIDKNGNIIDRQNGTRTQVSHDGRLMRDNVMTHNHPGPDAPFSSSDLKDVSVYNPSEVRAVSRNYTYSMKRPQGGWGNLKPEKIARTYNAIGRKVKTEWKEQFYSAGGGAPLRQLYFKYRIEVQRRLAAKFGWDFSYKRNS